MGERKIKGGGSLVVWVRERTGLSQAEFAKTYADNFGMSIAQLTAKLKNLETDRQQVPVDFLTRLGEVVGLEDGWFETVAILQRKPGVPSGRSASTIEDDIHVPRAPSSSNGPWRSSYLTERKKWGHTLALPAIFADGLPAQAEGQYPTLIADVIETVEEASPPQFKLGDRLGIRTDLMPEPGRMVLATGKDGKRYRRVLTMSGGAYVLRDLSERKQPDLRLQDVATLEGVILGRARHSADSSGEKYANVAYRAKGLTPDDL